MTVRFGLLGAGRIGKVHAKAVTGDANATLIAVADAMAAAAQAESVAEGVAMCKEAHAAGKGGETLRKWAALSQELRAAE